MRRLPMLCLPLLALAATASPAAAQAAEEGRTILVEVHDDRFVPAVVEARPGDVVRFVQGGTRRHNVEFRMKGAPEGFDFGPDRRSPYLVEVGDVYEIQVDERFEHGGTYPFLCTPHSIVMKGELRVGAQPSHASLP